MINKLIITLLMLIISLSCAAGNLGSFGQTYPIAEIDFLDFIQSKLLAMKDNGELQKINEKFKQNVEKHVDRPNAVSGLTRTRTQRSWIIDPSIVAPYDLRGYDGRIIVNKGTKVNPLNYISIHRPMVFINGDDKNQIEWVKSLISIRKLNIKIVLVSGSVSDVVSVIKQPVYFDQEGRIVARFNIHHVPAIAYQENTHLRIEEVVP